MIINIIPPALIVYLTKFLFSLKKFNASVVNKPKIINGIIKPSVYNKTKAFPEKILFAFEANIKTEDSAGPTHGVQAKLNVNPIMKAISGFILTLFKSR